MRLKSINLAGFKSFVDPTRVLFPGELTAIVGPNGCGKSNIIDAVRWVMGESSAKHLRGESMADVIFNGSSARKPVGQASIELVFDNGEGSLGGEYAAFTEIALRRTVSRDGLSQYSLNGSRCRRRDITDIFLGTGLGPRSYAIIEQGMISRLIEAKPDELRVYIEEAAGISKYKERRRDTENRMRRTRENLERLSDLRDELQRQLQHLKRQANAAERYGDLKTKERQSKAELLAQQWRSMDGDLEGRRKQIAEVEGKSESLNADHARTDREIEEHRDRHTQLGDEMNKIQETYYALGAEIARVEQAIQFQQDRSQQLRNELEQTENNHRQSSEHIIEDEASLGVLQLELDEVAPELRSAEEREAVARETLIEAEQRNHRWQQDWDEFNLAAQRPQQHAQVLQSRIGHLEEALAQGAERLGRLAAEEGELSIELVSVELASLQERLTALDAERARDSRRLEALAKQIKSGRERLSQAQERRQALLGEIQVMRGREASLQALQQAAMGSTDEVVSAWLSAQNLDRAERLFQCLDVEPGWETAVETVLGNHLQAVCTDSIDALAGVLDELEAGLVTLFTARQATDLQEPIDDSRLLATRVQADFPLDSLLGGVFAAETLDEALVLRHGLETGQTVITRDGRWIGRDWLRVARDRDATAGVIVRRRELDELAMEITARIEDETLLGHELASLSQGVEGTEQEREGLQLDVRRTASEYAEQRAEAGALQASMDQIELRGQRNRAEQVELGQSEATQKQQMSQARSELEACLAQMGHDEQQRETLLLRRDEVRKGLDEARQLARDDKDSLHDLAMRRQSLQTRMASLQSSIERTRTQYQQLQSRTQQLELLIDDAEQPISGLQVTLEEKLDARLNVEQELGDARREVQEEDHRLREAERRRHEIEQETEQVRGHLEERRLEAQGIQVRLATVDEQIEESGFDVADLIESLPDDASEEAWQAELQRIGNAIQRLGPINLAAIDEYRIQSERKDYLDSQNADLEAALETLENAMRRIDRETRTRFKETFDRVNQGLKDLFPRVFGGGHAYLELTGDDLLSTGVTIMARPPGKRNATIHLLSGGEKALTAIALVFSIFQLNPSPFCMLDEVDAPLDDVNVGRFTRLVIEMSSRVQFIVITHNKITMEVASRLMGVTMSEPGVSRLVSVDVDEAVELAQTA